MAIDQKYPTREQCERRLKAGTNVGPDATPNRLDLVREQLLLHDEIDRLKALKQHHVEREVFWRDRGREPFPRAGEEQSERGWRYDVLFIRTVVERTWNATDDEVTHDSRMRLAHDILAAAETVAAEWAREEQK